MKKSEFRQIIREEILREFRRSRRSRKRSRKLRNESRKLRNLFEQLPFHAASSSTGKIVNFKTQQSRDAAVQSGTHKETPESQELDAQYGGGSSPAPAQGDSSAPTSAPAAATQALGPSKSEREPGEPSMHDLDTRDQALSALQDYQPGGDMEGHELVTKEDGEPVSARFYDAAAKYAGKSKFSPSEHGELKIKAMNDDGTVEVTSDRFGHEADPAKRGSGTVYTMKAEDLYDIVYA